MDETPSPAPLHVDGPAGAGHAQAGRRHAGLLALLALAQCAGALAWFASVDAPITDSAMLGVAAGLLASALATGSALLAIELSLAGEPRGVAAWRRLALALQLAGLLLLLVAAAMTLNLRGSDDDPGDEAETRLTLAHAPYAALRASSRAATSSGRWS